ncbi:MAG: hypothetical protein V4590_00130 [Bacteroidota bacterium]
MQHKLGKKKYIESKDFQTDWLSVKMASFAIYDINWKLLLLNNRFFAEKVLLVSPDIYVFRDKRIPSKYKYRALPATLLRQMKFQLSIPAIQIEDGKITYEELTKKNSEKIKVPFYHLWATIHHLSTDTMYIVDHPVMLIDAESAVFDSVKTSISYSANMLSPSDAFSMKGTIESFSAQMLNKYITSATRVFINDGFVKSIEFTFTANEDEANGTMMMDYHNLKVTILKQEEKGEVKRRALKSALVNLFIRNEDKKQKKSALHEAPPNTPIVSGHTGTIHFKRRKDRFIFNYWWNSFKSGVSSTIVKAPTNK